MNPAVNVLIDRLEGRAPRTAIILGSGLGGLVDHVRDEVRIPYIDLPGFPAGNVSGHAREVVAGSINGQQVMMLSGRVHFYEKGDATAMRPIIETLRDLGITTLVLTNAAGSLDDKLPPGSVMTLSDHIAWSGQNPLVGEESDARFVNLSEVYDADLRTRIHAAAKRAGESLGEGVYMWFSGPTFETPAEIRAARILGADAVGMSTVPEAILARFYGLRVAGFSIITNMGAGLGGGEISHDETKEMAPLGGARLARILLNAFENGDL